uniref:DNA topoisomerase (ATP-hydrolyzing) n=1 Tax=Fagus sylvatica TaxID=28930 RepID=A0A2N9FB41_FAGSY
MEGNRWSSQRCDLLRKIREFTGAIVHDLSIGRSPIIFINRFRIHCSNPHANWFAVVALICQMGRKFSHFKGKAMCVGLVSGFLTFNTYENLMQLLQENRHGSKRDIYYMHPSVFSEQSVVDRAINDICILMQCSRYNLNVPLWFKRNESGERLKKLPSVGCTTLKFLSAKGRLVMGWIRFLEDGRKFDCINQLNTAHPIPVHVEEVKDIISVAHYILVVEKESVFERLANDQFCNANRCIVITQMAYDAKYLRCPEVCWLGVFPSDSEKYCLPQKCLLPLTAEDKRKTEAMLNRCYLEREVPRWRLELELMLQRGVKFEIEALSVHSLSFLSKEYIPSKIQGGVHF